MPSAIQLSTKHPQEIITDIEILNTFVLSVTFYLQTIKKLDLP